MTYAKEDFLDFKFGEHWASEYGLVRVSNSKRYDANVTPTLTDKTVEVPGGDGMYFFSAYHKQRQFTVQVAFDHITESQLRAIRVWLNGKDVQPLIFAEDLVRLNDGTIPPETDDRYNGRQYFAKVTGTPSLKYVPFDEPTEPRKSNNTDAVIPASVISTEVIYKGEGTIQFTCYDPYAYDIKYSDQTDQVGGEVDTSFVLTINSGLNSNTTITITGISSITILSGVVGTLEWNSKTGVVVDVVRDNQNNIVSRTPINFSGNSMVNLPVGTNISITITGTDGVTPTLTYYNRYY